MASLRLLLPRTVRTKNPVLQIRFNNPSCVWFGNGERPYHDDGVARSKPLTFKTPTTALFRHIFMTRLRVFFSEDLSVP